MMMLVNGDYVPQENHLRSVEGDEAVLQRMLMKLTARRGQFPFMENFGSRLWTLDRLRPAERQAAADRPPAFPDRSSPSLSHCHSLLPQGHLRRQSAFVFDGVHRQGRLSAVLRQRHLLYRQTRLIPEGLQHILLRRSLPFRWA